MSDPYERQISETKRREDPAADRPDNPQPEPNYEHPDHLTPAQVERIEESVRDEVAAHPTISDS
jgi:hypothetical protein